jgi:hypothetical protein
MKRIAVVVTLSSLVTFAGTAMASSGGGSQPSVFTTLMNLLLGNDPTTPVAAGQPNQSCQAEPPGSTPGHSANAPGSAFNPAGTAGMNYAGQKAVNQKNPVSVAQSDVACANQANRLQR